MNDDRHCSGCGYFWCRLTQMYCCKMKKRITAGRKNGCKYFTSIMEKLMVNTIYPAFMGEVSKFGIGAKCTFLRLSGCNLRCYKDTMGILCDTPEALDFKCGKAMDHWEILSTIAKYGNSLVCLTGGEPLMQDVKKLLETLSSHGYDVVVETNGSKTIYPYRNIKNVSFVVDCKGVSSGESERMFEENYGLMDSGDFLKFVINDKEDYWEMRAWLGNHPKFKGNVAVGLFWGSKMGYQELMTTLQEDRLNVYVNMQTHKMAVMYDEYRDSVQKLTIPKEL